MQIKRNYNLSKLNTFKVDARAKFFAEIKSEKSLKELLGLPEFKKNKKMFLGAGSNILFTKDFNGMLVLNSLRGIEILEENNNFAVLRSMGGERWHHFVLFAVKRGYWGIENLSLIPGTVGAAPVQNIGAYGSEIKDVLLSIEAYETKTGEKRIFSKEDCKLAYRDSVFKNKLKGKYFISAVILKLNKKRKRKELYPALRKYLEKKKIFIRNPADICRAVIAIRQSKLPNPKILGNAGSFFKNVFINKNQLFRLQKKYPAVPFFREKEKIKIPAGWLIEQSGWKGKRIEGVGVYDKQALILVNYGKATGRDILRLSKKIVRSVRKKFGLKLEPEVNIV